MDTVNVNFFCRRCKQEIVGPLLIHWRRGSEYCRDTYCNACLSRYFDRIPDGWEMFFIQNCDIVPGTQRTNDDGSIDLLNSRGEILGTFLPDLGTIV